jgi:hypothetical protein
MSRPELEDLVRRFLDAFNREDLDEVMSFFGENAVYDEFNGRRSHGREAIRAAFVPQFRGDFGRIRFLTEDLFVDAEEGKALVRWVCTFERDGRHGRWRGLDILHWSDGKLVQKHTYAKAAVPLLSE